MVCDVVPEVVSEVLVVGDVVAVDVAVVVDVVVGVVTWQLIKLLSIHASVIAFRLPAVVSQLELSKSSVPKAHPTVSLVPAGPRYSLIIALIAAAVAAQSALATTKAGTPNNVSSQPIAAAVVGHDASTAFNVWA